MAIATVNPSNGVVVKEFEADSPAEVERKLALAAQMAPVLASTAVRQRSEWLRKAADLLEADVKSLAATMVLEMGKPIGQAEAEVLKSAKGLRFYADHAEDFLKDEWITNPAAVGASQAGTKWQPLGVVLAVMPWNYPLWQAIRFAAPALACGNVGLLKHASNVPQTAIYIQELFERAGFPKGAFTTLLIGARDVKAVIEDSRVKGMTITGSEPAGRSVAATAGEALKPSVLELGGSDPFIVMPSADIEGAVAAALKSRTLNNGQSCINAKRFLVHSDVYDKFTDLFVSKVKALKVGDPMDPSTEIGPLASESGRNEVVALVEDAVKKGAKVLAGGNVPDQPGWWFTPTVLADLPADALLIQEESFGPVASMYRVSSLDEAIKIANQTRFGLSSAIWSTDAAELEKAVNEIEAGAVFVNGFSISFNELPFGGIKASGYGRELALVGMREFMNMKTVWKA
ncbi:MAG: aldehyde dehydrogenase family protein [Micrococcales bacterium]